jgi:hypothetical protein
LQILHLLYETQRDFYLLYSGGKKEPEKQSAVSNQSAETLNAFTAQGHTVIEVFSKDTALAEC